MKNKHSRIKNRIIPKSINKEQDQATKSITQFFYFSHLFGGKYYNRSSNRIYAQNIDNLIQNDKKKMYELDLLSADQQYLHRFYETSEIRNKIKNITESFQNNQLQVQKKIISHNKVQHILSSYIEKKKKLNRKICCKYLRNLTRNRKEFNILKQNLDQSYHNLKLLVKNISSMIKNTTKTLKTKKVNKFANNCSQGDLQMSTNLSQIIAINKKLNLKSTKKCKSHQKKQIQTKFHQYGFSKPKFQKYQNKKYNNEKQIQKCKSLKILPSKPYCMNKSSQHRHKIPHWQSRTYKLVSHSLKKY